MSALVIARRSFHSSLRARKYFLFALDGTDAAAPDRRHAARPDHLVRAQKEKDDGVLLTATTLFNDTKDKMIGSALTLNLPDKAAVEAWIKEDPYHTQGVWKDVKIYAALTAPLK